MYNATFEKNSSTTDFNVNIDGCNQASLTIYNGSLPSCITRGSQYNAKVVIMETNSPRKYANVCM